MYHGYADACSSCGASLAGARVCSTCGAEQPADPLVGRIIGNRYEILELLGVGGMGRVYRAMHVGLDRMVAVKFINPKHLANQAAVARFMVEARAASRLSHPNVVAIHDFGGGTAAEGEELYLVMELLSGRNLHDVLREGAMSIPRAVEVLCQILAALNEAHHHGVTHRDIKPENIIVEPSGAGGDHVKVIDFGIAKVHAGTNVTRPGEIVGTPRYMAPEQARGQPAGPAADIYSVGVLMFQMLTGRRAFNGRVAYEIIGQILSAHRPDPSVVAPDRGIPPQLGAVCMRAMALDASQRFPTAEAFARAVVEAAAQTWSSAHAMLFFPRSPASDHGSGATSPEPRAAKTIPASAPEVTVPDEGSPTGKPRALTPGNRPTLTPTPLPTTPAGPKSERFKPTLRMRRTGPGQLVGREADLAWARDQLSYGAGADSFVLCGRTGSGRTRLLDEITGVARQMGITVVRPPGGPPPPMGEVSGSGLRAIIPVLLGEQADADMLARRSGGAPPEVATLRCLLASISSAGESGAGSAQLQPIGPGSLAAALRWALSRSVAVSEGGHLLLALDDVDRFDRPSQMAIAAALSGRPISGLLVAMTSEEASGRWSPNPAMTRTRLISGLSCEDAERWYGAARRHALGRSDGDVEPLHIELLSHGWGDMFDSPPGGLFELVERRLRCLSPLELRIVQAIAVLGRRPVNAVAAVADPDTGMDASLDVLARAEIVAMDDTSVWLRHAVFGRAALALAPRALLTKMHTRAAATVTKAQHRVELRAYHALRGRRPDLDAFLCVDESAQLRLGFGDFDGAIQVLGDGFQAARGEVLAGELEAAIAWAPLGRRLGIALLEAGRVDEAYGVLSEMHEQTDRRSIERALVGEQLALVAERRGRNEEAQALLREALVIAEAVRDQSMVARIRANLAPRSSGVRPSTREGSDAKEAQPARVRMDRR